MASHIHIVKTVNEEAEFSSANDIRSYIDFIQHMILTLI